MLLLIAAFPLEFAGFTSAVSEPSREVRWLATAEVGGRRALLAANGIGRTSATTAVRALLATHRIDAVVSTGFAGALSSELRVGDAFLADTVLDGPRRYRGGQPAQVPEGVCRGSLMTVNAIAHSARVKAALAASGAAAVDMESAAVAAVAADCGARFYCLRVISDAANADLPLDFNRALRPDGSLSVWNLASQAALRPGTWKGLLRLRRDASFAASALARCLARCDFGD